MKKRACRPLADRFWSHVRKGVGCWEWTAFIMVNGYGYLGSSRIGEGLTHRISWVLHFGEIPAGICVCHHCDNRKCVRPDHLFLGTQGDNMRDMIQKGRGSIGKPGSTNHASKLRAADVEQIRALAAAGVSQKKIALDFGVSQPSVWEIVHRKIWKHVS